MSSVTVYGTDWCEDTRHTRQHLDRLGVSYDYIDIDQDEQAREWVRQQNGGKQKTPTVDIAGQVLSVPDDAQVDEALRDRAEVV